MIPTPQVSRLAVLQKQWLLILALVVGLVPSLAPSAALATVTDAYGSAYDLSAALATSPSSFSDPATDVSTFTRDAVEVDSLTTCGNYPPIPANTYSTWYKYIAPASGGWLTLSTLQAGTNFDTVLQVWSGSVSPATNVACNDDAVSGNRRSELTIPVTASNTYYIVIRRWGTSAMPLPPAPAPATLAFSARFTSAREIYVDQNNGNDSNPGSFDLPVRTIQRGVDLASANDTVIVAAGSYGENVTLNKSLTLVGAGNPDTASFTLQSGTTLGAGSGGIAAPTVNVQVGALVNDGILLVANDGAVNLGAGTFAQNVVIGKPLTLQSSAGATLQPASGAAITVNTTPVAITGLNITSASGVNNTTGSPINAASNWWNSPNGPTASTNPGGTGSSLTGAANYRPWCTVAAPTCNATGGVATKLIFTTSPSNSAAGVVFATQPVVQAQDAAGIVDTSFTGPVSLVIKPGSGTAGATLAGTVTVNAVGGTATFSGLSINLIGNAYQLTASSGPLTPADSSAFNITAGSASALVFNPSPSNSTGGVAFPTQPVVEVRDAGGNLVTGYSGSVTLSIANNPGGGTLAGGLTVAVSGGKATFSGLSIDKPGVGYTLQATSGALTSAPSASFDITVGSPAQLIFTTSPSNSSAGVAFPTQPVVEVRDAGGNLLSSYTGNVSLAIANNPGGGTLSGTATVAAVGGIATFSGLSIDKSGTGYTLVATSAALTSAPSAPFNIIAGAATQLAFITSPGDTRAGTAFSAQPVVQARDIFGNLATSFSGPVAVAIKAGTGAVGAVLAPVANLTVNAVNGVATFSGLNIDKVFANYQLTASSAGLTAADSNTFNITATGLTFTVQPVNSQAGQTLIVKVAAQDASNNTDTSFNGTVTLAIKPGTGTAGATLGRNVTVNAVNGVADFSAAGLNIQLVGSGYIITASASGLAGAESTPFDITAGAAARLVFTTSPVNTPAGSTLALVVEAQDAFGNRNTSFTGSVGLTIQINPGGGALGGTVSKAAVGGVASFGAVEGLNINRVGVGYRLRAASGSLASGDSMPFNITASRLVFSVSPSNSPVGSRFPRQPVVRAVDNFGNLDVTFTGTITLSIANGTGALGAALNGPIALAAVGGVATFSGLSIDTIGTGYQLTVAGAGLAGSTSAAFNITNATVFVPMMVRPNYPDLVGSFSLSTNTISADKPVVISVTITNQGKVPARQFWVDFYINPLNPPTAPNQPWDKRCGQRRCEQGIAWYVTQTLAPGQSITLTSTPDSYYAKNTDWHGSFNTSRLNLYLYVDSWNPGEATGAVLESNETNNRSEFHTPSVTSAAAAYAERQLPIDLPSLPARPARPQQEP